MCEHVNKSALSVPLAWRREREQNILLRVITSTQSASNERFVLELDDGGRIEAVRYRGDSLCVSSQVGCAVGCPFCASGANGSGRALALSELVGQVDLLGDESLKHVTVSGVGEPLHNPRLLEFIDLCRERRFKPSVTTSGANLKALPTLLKAPHNGVTISVHAGTQEVRSRSVPGGPELDPLFEVLSTTLPKLSGRRRKKIALAYLVVAGLNDSDREVDAFIERAKPLNRIVHLYAFNEVPTSELRAVSRKRYEDIYERMKHFLRVRMSSKARLEENGGCGTLVALNGKRRVASQLS